jgi:hypothetical protein
VAREGGVPIRIVDYSVLLPDQALRAKEVDTRRSFTR